MGAGVAFAPIRGADVGTGIRRIREPGSFFRSWLGFWLLDRSLQVVFKFCCLYLEETANSEFIQGFQEQLWL